METKKVGIWIRVSTDEQAKGESPEHHEKRARMYAEMKGWEVIEIYHLEGVSGKAVIQHHEAQRMLHDIANGKIEALIFSKLARLARNVKELLEFSQRFQDAKVDMVSIQESIDTTTPAGRFFYTLLAAMAQWEREEISDRVKASVVVRAKLGKPLGGATPFGYSRDGQDLVINEEEAAIRKMMFELYLEHRRKKTVANIINDKGFRTRNGSKFTATTLVRLLSDPLAKGLRRANYTYSTGEGKGWKLKDESEWIYYSAPAIVSEELWDEVNTILKDQKANSNYPQKTATHVFTGVLFCECGSKMVHKTSLKKYCCNSCKRKIRPDDLDMIFHEQLKQYSFSKEALEHDLQQSEIKLRDFSKELDLLHKQKGTLQKKIDSLFELHSSGQIETKDFNRHFSPFKEQMESIEQSLPEIEGKMAAQRVDHDSAQDIIKEAQDLYTNYPSFTNEEKRKIVHLVTNQITIGENEVEIQLAFLSPRQNGGLWGMNPHGFIEATN